MPRHSDAPLLAAVRAGRAYAGWNAVFEPEGGTVALYGRVVARIEPARVYATPAGSSTPRSFQLLNALMLELCGRAPLRRNNLRLFLDGEPLDLHAWFSLPRLTPWPQRARKEKGPDDAGPDDGAG